MTTEYGEEIAIVVREALEERDELEAELGMSDCGRVLYEKLGVFFAREASSEELWGVE